MSSTLSREKHLLIASSLKKIEKKPSQKILKYSKLPIAENMKTSIITDSLFFVTSKKNIQV
jgi:hypothetical protein